MSTARDFERFMAGFQAGQASDFAALMRAADASSTWQQDRREQRPTQAQRDHFHLLLAASIAPRANRWSACKAEDVTGYLARQSILRSSRFGFI